MAKPLDLAPILREQLLRWRWAIAALAAAFFFTFEVVEHYPLASSLTDPNFVREVLLFGFVGPLLAGLVLSLLASTRTARVRANQNLNLERELSRQLASAAGWEELTTLIVRFPRSVLPVVGTSLLVRGQGQDQFDLAAEWWAPDEQSPTSPTLHLPGDCPSCAYAHSSQSETAYRCDCLDNAPGTEHSNRYCLPLVHGGMLVGLLYQYFPYRIQPPAEPMESLNALAPAMALALDSARSPHAAAFEMEAIRTERRRIARNLHDTLGQSLGYLHLKLDQLSGDDALQEIGEIRRELERMRIVANKSYRQVRGAVVALRSSTPTDLTITLLEHTRSVGDRVGFEVELFSEGQPRPLASHVQRQVLNIVREGFSNVEKHANARRVDTFVLWGEESLSIILSDDGKGFDTNRLSTNGHFGLEIMRERAAEIGGELILTSTPCSGTELTLMIPTPTPVPGSNGGG
jgi:signal transduction histidine kinase